MYGSKRNEREDNSKAAGGFADNHEQFREST